MRFWCCVGSAVLAAACIVPLPASALQSTVTLTVAQTVALFGNTITCEYYATDGTYKTSTATFDGYGANAIGYTNFVDSSGISLANRQFAYYLMPMPSDYDPSASSMSILFKTAIDISSLDYFDTALIYSSNIDTSSQLYGTYVGYWYCSDGYHYAAHQGASGTSAYNLYGFVRDNSSRQCLTIPLLYQSSSNTSFSTGWANIGGWSALSGTNSVAIGIVCPIISQDWVFDGSTGAGAGSSSSGSGSDSGGGTDLSGVYTRLDDIIDKLDAIIANTAGSGSSENSSQNASDQAAVNSRASLLESRYNEANSYNDNVYEVADLDSVALPDLENSYTDLPADFSKFWYIDGNATFFVLMLTLTGSIALVAFIIFGKSF